MLKNIRQLLPLIALFWTFIPLSLHSQPSSDTSAAQPAQPPGQNQEANYIEVDSLNDLDARTGVMGRFIRQNLSGLPQGSRIRVGNFLFENTETSLGVYLHKQLLLLSVADNSREGSRQGGREGHFVILNDVEAQADYLLNGEFLKIGDVLRLYTWLINLQDSSLTNAWNLDLLLSPFVQGLISQGTIADNSAHSGSTGGGDVAAGRDNPIRVETGGQVSRTLTQGGEDWFSIQAESDSILILETTGSTDTFIELYSGESGESLGSDDDGGEGNNARISRFAVAGSRFMVKVRGYSRTTSGQYTFRARAVPVVELEIGSETSRVLEQGDEHWFSIRTTGNQTVIIETAGDTDTFMELYEMETWRLIARNDDGGEGTNARISQSLSGAVVYMIKIRGYSSEIAGAYRLIVSTYDSDSSANNPIAVAVGEEVSRTLRPGEEHWFSTRAETRGILIFETTGNIDSFMELYGGDPRELLEVNDDGGEGNNARIFRFVEEGSDYIVKVRGYSNSTAGSYNFRVRYFSMGESEIEVGSPIELVFSSSSDVHIVRFTITQPGNYQIRTRSQDGSLDTVIGIYNENFELIADDDDSGGNLDAYINMRFESGIYFIFIAVLGSDPIPNGAYTLSLSISEENV